MTAAKFISMARREAQTQYTPAAGFTRTKNREKMNLLNMFVWLWFRRVLRFPSTACCLYTTAL